MKHLKVTLFFVSLLLLLALWSLFAALGIWVFIVVVLVWIGVVAVGSSFLQLNYHVRAYCEPSEHNQKVALTFDDGPAPETLQVLDLLAQHGAKATFFCIGTQLEKYPEIAQRIHAEGHLLANHSYSHSHFFDFFGQRRVLKELQQTDALITQITGKKPLFFRPPYGVTNPSIRRALQQSGHEVMGWNLRSMDGISAKTAKIVVKITQKIRGGSIVLLHDNRPHATIILEQLLTSLRAKNLEAVRLDALLQRTAYKNTETI